MLECRTSQCYINKLGLHRAWVKCGPADRQTGKLRTKPAHRVRSLPVGRSAGPHLVMIRHQDFNFDTISIRYFALNRLVDM